jgi:para-nitrobenzyl esterase
MVIVTTKIGKLEGNKERNHQSFLGIPYVKPPIDDVRFKETQILHKWDGILNTMEFGPCAYQGDALEITDKIPIYIEREFHM